MSDKITQRAEALVRVGAEMSSMMEENEKLGVLIYAAQETGDEEDMQAVIDATFALKCHMAQMIGSLALISGQIDNTSAAAYLHTVSCQFIDHELETDPADVLLGLIEGMQP